jgi:hypothetical protein
LPTIILGSSSGNMAVEVDLAMASLIIAITALFIAGLQIFQNMLGHVEGLRRCAPSVAGPWAKLRRRKWMLTELRIELEFTTPHFLVLSSDYDRATAAHTYGLTYDMPTLSRAERLVERPIKSLWHRLWDLVRRMTRPPSDHRPQYTTWDYEKHFEVLKESIKEEDKLEPEWMKPMSSEYQDLGELEKSSRRPIDSKTLWIKPRSEIRASWLQLLAALYADYKGYDTSKMRGPRSSSGSAYAAVACRRWNWDFMPSDLIKASASSTLRDILLLAMRLRMDWRRTDLDNSIFMADGNGYSITSTDARGSGISFTFKTTGPHSDQRVIPPSETADKTLFGILPGCKELIGRDFPLINNDRVHNFASMFKGMGIEDREVVKKMAEENWCEQRIDAMILMSAFIPSEACSISYNYLPGFRGVAPITPLHYFEGRVAFLEALQDRLESLKGLPQNDLDILQEATEHLRMLFDDWKHDFLDKWDRSVIEGHDDDKKIILIKVCHKVFIWATNYLKGKQWNDQHDGRTRYMHLVAAHCVNAYHATIDVNEHQDWYHQYKNNNELRKRHLEDYKESHGSEVGFNTQYHVAKSYVHGIRNGDHNIIKYLRDKGIRSDKLNDDEVEAAWWVTIVKGIAWDMSTTGDPSFRSKGLRWNPPYVPSKFYDIRSPVWIT